MSKTQTTTCPFCGKKSGLEDSGSSPNGGELIVAEKWSNMRGDYTRYDKDITQVNCSWCNGYFYAPKNIVNIKS